MEQDKYYTPSLNEFHLGFRYEYNELDICDHRNWEEYIISECDLSEWNKPDTKKSDGGIKWCLEEGLIRVKYLDREDFESLGFKVLFGDSYEDNEIWELEIGSYFIYWHPWENKMTFHVKEYTDHDEYWGDHGIWFTIKNRSELRRLLKQLGIDD